MELYNQSLALGHEIVRFERFGSSLRIVADQKHLYESDINHPARLIHELPILRETETTLTVRIDRASPTLVTVAGTNESAPARTSWIRDTQYIEDGNYLLIQSTLETAKGELFEFHESLFPRETLVPENYEPLLNDSALEPLAERFRFLSNAPVYVEVAGAGRVHTAAANRYLLTTQKTLDWYVTRNAPDEYIEMIGQGVEGWNRYSQAMWGRDFIRFAGYLPEGIAIGDPRFNVINWDSVSEAGAAYEMQASDPISGLQSHALIYLPKAWVNIGRNYWERGQTSESEPRASTEKLGPAGAPTGRNFLGRKIRTNCSVDAWARLPAPHQILTGADPATFGKELLRGTLFHEVGHALGLDHNFKGSLSFAGSSTAFSTSIMDYNQFHLEQAAFNGESNGNGPLLEYDRQILSALYHESQDITEKDPIVPACNDSEADSAEGTVDPLCIRYDAGADPTERLESTRRLIDAPEYRLGSTLSLVAALEKTASLTQTEILPGDFSGEGTLEERLEDFANLIAAKTTGTVHFYTNSGAQSLSAMTNATLKTLLTNESDLAGIPELELDWATYQTRYDLPAMRSRVFEVLRTTLSHENLPVEVLQALSHISDALHSRLTLELVMDGRAPSEALTLATQLASDAEKRVTSELKAGKSPKSALGKARKSILSRLSRRENVPFYFEASSSDAADLPATSIDYESAVIGLLKSAAITPYSQLSSEREAAIDSLLTYQGTETGDAAITELRSTLQQELKKVRYGDERDQYRNWLKRFPK